MIGLCYRCEYRAQYLETGSKPRYECGEPNFCSISCYMYRPVAPIAVKSSSGDKRPLFGMWAVSARVERIADTETLTLLAKKVKKGWLLYWVPREDKGKAVKVG